MTAPVLLVAYRLTQPSPAQLLALELFAIAPEDALLWQERGYTVVDLGARRGVQAPPAPLPWTACSLELHDGRSPVVGWALVALVVAGVVALAIWRALARG
ncbi:MAG TPA: hypothetical protein VII06_09745 [Chloroflexota bacterium]|jgi:hypothetical protein